MFIMYANNSYTHLIPALGIVRKPTVWNRIALPSPWHTLHWPTGLEGGLNRPSRGPHEAVAVIHVGAIVDRHLLDP